MEKCLLSIDWDYFIYTRNNWGLYLENKRCLVDLWYKRYVQEMARGRDIQKEYQLSSELHAFWSKTRKRFKFAENNRLVMRNSPALESPDASSPFTVGNGEFAFTADITGLQTFMDDYEYFPCAQCRSGGGILSRRHGLFKAAAETVRHLWQDGRVCFR
ncbi:MAG: hypothetical protein ACOX4M_05590 [Acetivibrionales bacterium]